MRPDKYYFIGGISPGRQGHGGETIKNTLFLKYLKDRQIDVELIDTVKGKKNKFFFLFQIFKTLLIPGNQSIILSAATHSAYRYIKLAKFFNFFRKKIIYFVIGGTITERIEKGEIRAEDLKSVDAIYIESKAMKSYLNKIGLNHIHYMPNFKPLKGKILYKEHLKNDDTFRLVFLSRIKAEKGVKVLIKIFKKLKDRGFKVSLDFFGPVEDGFEKEFTTLVQATQGVVYNGFLDLVNDDVRSYKTLSQYDLMVFPTYHYGEGFPGVFIDCFAAGVPVIASDWKYNSEILENNLTGFLTEVKSVESNIDKIQLCIENLQLLNRMKKECNNKALKFDIAYLLDPIFCNSNDLNPLKPKDQFTPEPLIKPAN